MRIVSVLLTVLLTFFTSVLLSISASKFELISFLGGLVIIMVVFLNIVKFFIWGWLNKHYDLSKTYPLTALFFPLIFIYAILNGNSEVTINKIIGLITILIGLVWMEFKKSKC